jgi:hypothetical protein
VTAARSPRASSSNRLAVHGASMLQTVSSLAQIELDAQLAREMQQQEAAAPEVIDLTEDHHRPSTSYDGAASKRPRPVEGTPPSLSKRRVVPDQHESVPTGPLRLMRTTGVRDSRGAVSLAEVLGHLDEHATVLVSNYLIDTDWLLGECPGLTTCKAVHVLYDSKNSPTVLRLGSLFPSVFQLHAPNLPSMFGTHHTKLVRSGPFGAQLRALPNPDCSSC